LQSDKNGQFKQEVQMELKLLNQTKSPSGGTFTAINHDGTKTEKSYGEIITSEYDRGEENE
jgi:hypothetical protein